MKTVLVTLANREYLDAARQLFASAHFAGGWKGDYVLLTLGVENADIRDFVDKGIQVCPVDPLPESSIPDRKMTIVGKLDIFSPFFRQWDRVLYLDGDMIVRARLRDDLLVPRFGAVRDLLNLRSQYRPGSGPADLTDASAFNTGMLSFNTNIIENNTYSKLLSLLLAHWRTTRLVDQPAVNYYFRDLWEPLPMEYNVFAHLKIFGRYWREHGRGTIVHFTSSPKPWDAACAASADWRANLKRFASLDVRDRHIGIIRSPAERTIQRILLQIRFRLARADIRVGEAATAIRNKRGA
jgi:hypothetical protein